LVDRGVLSWLNVFFVFCWRIACQGCTEACGGYHETFSRLLGSQLNRGQVIAVSRRQSEHLISAGVFDAGAGPFKQPVELGRVQWYALWQPRG
jgi:hypothetical protein